MDTDFHRDILKEIVYTLIDEDVHNILQQSAMQRHETAQKIQQGIIDESNNSDETTMTAYLHIKPRLVKLLRNSGQLDFHLEANDLVDTLMEELFLIEDEYLAKLQQN